MYIDQNLKNSKKTKSLYLKLIFINNRLTYGQNLTHTFLLTLNTLKKKKYICGYYNTYNN